MNITAKIRIPASGWCAFACLMRRRSRPSWTPGSPGMAKALGGDLGAWKIPLRFIQNFTLPMITSTKNPKIQWVRGLQSRAQIRREEGAFVVEGLRLVEEALAAGWEARLL